MKAMFARLLVGVLLLVSPVAFAQTEIGIGGFGGTGTPTGVQIVTGLGAHYDVLYTEGTSEERGHNLTGAQLPNGGLTGNYSNVLCSLPWMSSTTCYNDAVDGSGTGGGVGPPSGANYRYTRGNNIYGVTVPSASSLAPNTTGKHGLFLISLVLAYNDGGDGPTSAANIQTLVNLAKADGWKVGLITSFVGGDVGSGAAERVFYVNQQALNGAFGVDLVIDSAWWFGDRQNTAIFPDGLHLSAAAHIAMAGNLQTCFVIGSCPANMVGGNVGFRPLGVTAYFNPGTPLINIWNPNNTSTAEIYMRGNAKQAVLGMAGDSYATVGGLANHWYMFDLAGSRIPMDIDFGNTNTNHVTFRHSGAGVAGTISSSNAAGCPAWQINETSIGEIGGCNASAASPFASSIFLYAKSKPINLIQNDGTTDQLRVQIDANGGLARQLRTVGAGSLQIPACAAGNKGSSYLVSDALAPVPYATVAGGGAALAKITCDGTNWGVF